MAKKFYITTAIDYVNAAPHIGHAYEKICADVIARWNRLLGNNVFFLTGTDENAQKNASAANEANVPTQKFIDQNVKIFQKLCKKLNLTNDYFIRTTEERHKKISQDIFKKVYDKGDIYKGSYEGLYCEGCEAFITEKELVNGKCPEHNKAPEIIKEESYFFKMSKYEKEIIKLLEDPQFIIPEGKRKEMLNRVKSEGLKDLSVSRINKEWGIKAPIDQEHIIYVWFDALINYVSALDYPNGKNYKTYWPADVHLIGKGINWFHSVIWPSILMSAEVPLPKTILVHGYVNMSGQKISKSSGGAVNPIDIIDKYGGDALRYFLVREIPFGQDGDFSEASLIGRLNNELANELGNLVNRTVSLIETKLKRKVTKTKIDRDIGLNLKDIEKSMEKYELHSALAEIFRLVQLGNKYINEKEPWKVESETELNYILYNLCELLRVISILLSPFIPETCNKINKQLGVKEGLLKDCKLGKEEKYLIKKSEVLFKKVEKK